MRDVPKSTANRSEWRLLRSTCDVHGKRSERRKLRRLSHGRNVFVEVEVIGSPKLRISQTSPEVLCSVRFDGQGVATEFRNAKGQETVMRASRK